MENIQTKSRTTKRSGSAEDKNTANNAWQNKPNRSEVKQRIENQRTTGEHLEAASQLHYEAAKHHENGEHDKAASNTLRAQGHLRLANEAQLEYIKSHTVNEYK